MLRVAARWHPQVVALDEDAFLGDVRDIDREAALVQDVADRRVHAALGRVADAGLAADLAEPAALVDEQLGHAVVVRDEQIGIAGAAQVGGHDRECPARRRRARRAALTSSNRPPPRLRYRYLRPPLFAYSKLSGMIFVVDSDQRLTSSAK